jgi:hypothetical protein
MELYRRPGGVQTRWSSFENPGAEVERGGMANRGAKGHALDWIAAGESCTLLDVRGSGVITRIWLTVDDRTPAMLRALRLDIYWDDADRPAVSAPLGDFFGLALGRRAVFESALFADPEGRSFNCFVPMPFRRRARVVLTNEWTVPLRRLFYDVNLLLDVPHGDDVLYLHAHWRRESPNALGQDYDVLPHVAGNGRFLGCNLGVITDSRYAECWWGEGEFKAWLDGDDAYPTLCGTGVEDYIGTAWGLGAYAHRTQGAPVADRIHGQWCFYRYHLDDPIYFARACRVAFQVMGGAPKERALALQQKGVPLLPVTIDRGGGECFTRLLDEWTPPIDLADPTLPEGWCNFYRQDDWSSTAYFYLDRPENDLPPLAPVRQRTAGLLSQADLGDRADG